MSNYKTQLQDISWIDKNAKIVFVTAEFNREFTSWLENESEKFLNEHGFSNIKKYLVPWAYEIPALLKLVVEKQKPDLIICFWVVIRWETTHYDMVAWESARWIMNVTLENPEISIINWILTCENEDQVASRIGSWYVLAWLNLLAEKKKI